MSRQPRPLTETQRRTLHRVVESVRAAGRAPTVRELAAVEGVTFQGIVNRLIALEKKGYIERDFGVARGIRVLREAA